MKKIKVLFVLLYKNIQNNIVVVVESFCKDIKRNSFRRKILKMRGNNSERITIDFLVQGSELSGYPNFSLKILEKLFFFLN